MLPQKFTVSPLVPAETLLKIVPTSPTAPNTFELPLNTIRPAPGVLLWMATSVEFTTLPPLELLVKTSKPLGTVKVTAPVISAPCGTPTPIDKGALELTTCWAKPDEEQAKTATTKNRIENRRFM